MSYKLLVAEKPSVAVSLANVLGANKNRCDGYFKGNGYIVTFAFGHLLEQFDAKDYDKDMESWELDKFPFIPQTMKYKIKTDKKTRKTDTGAKKQFGIIKSLMERNDVSEIIISTDHDREGEVIGLLLLKAIRPNKPIKRILVNEWTPTDIKNGLRNLKDYSEMKNLQNAGLARSESDWYIGINFTSAATLKFINGRSITGKNTVLNIGRVLLPTLKLIYDRDMEIKNFKPEKFYELKATFTSPKGVYDGLLIDGKESRFKDKAQIEAVKRAIDNNNAKITSKKVERKSKYAPKLFSMTDLQGHITSKYNGWTSDKVKKIAQSLYEGKGNGGFITYPRTKSRYLEETLIGKAEKVLDMLKEDLPFNNEIKFHTDKSVFNSKEVDGHSAIIPTNIKPSSLSKDEQVVYDEICKRFIAKFMPPAEYDHTEILTEVLTNNVVLKEFITKGKVLISEGWEKLYGKEIQDDTLPNVEMDEIVKVSNSEVLSKETQAPPHHTEKTLFKAMETCGRNLKKKVNNNDDLSEVDIEDILDGYEIGTPATRDEIIVKLISANYIARKGKSLIATDRGISLVEKFPVKELLDVHYTGKLEKALSEIEKGNYSKEAFIKHIISFVRKGVEDIKKSNVVIVDHFDLEANNDVEILGNCPVCNKPIIENKKGYGCSGYTDGCKFIIWKKNPFLDKFGVKSIDKKTAKALIESPSGIELRINSTIINASLVQKGEYHNLKFDINQEEKFTLGNCPKCNKEVIMNSAAYTCEDKECNFTIFKNDRYLARYKKKPTESMIKTLLSKGEISVKGMQSPNGKGKFDCTLKLKENGNYWGWEMVFDDKNTSDKASGGEYSSSSKEVIGKCPECDSDVTENSKTFSCSNEGCKFVLFKNDKYLGKFKKKITKSMAKDLLSYKVSYVDGMYSEKKKSHFSSNVKLVQNGSYWNLQLDFSK